LSAQAWDRTIVVVALVLIVGAVLIIIGIVALLNPDWAWAFTERTNTMRGQVSERTDRWDQGNRIGAVIAIVVGGGLVLLSLGR
jgi:hypothetical protein